METPKQLGPSPVVEAREVLCKSDRKALWTVLSNTERITRLVGGVPLVFEETLDAGASRYLARGKSGVFSMEYEEAPFEWTYPKQWTVLRRFRKGPLLTLINKLTLVTVEGGTRARVEVSMTPRRRWLRFPLKRTIKPILNTWEKVILEVDEALLNKTPLPGSPVENVHWTAFERAAIELRDMNSTLAGRLIDLIRTGDELELSQIRPYALAELWDVGRRPALAACLHGVRAGLLQMRWGIVCPSCQTATTIIPSLQDLGAHGSCHFCDIDFGINLEESVEALFSPHQAVRTIDTRTFCSGGPGRTPHVLSQVVLSAGEAAELVLPKTPGLYRLFVRGGAMRILEVVNDDGTAHVELSTTGVTGERLRLSPEAIVRLRNDSPKPLHAKIEEVREARILAATAHDVTTMPGFRRDFSSQLLRPGMALEVGRVGVLFTDLCGSTQLYADIGDAAAFNLVQDHFTLLFEIIERHDGSVVKTMGDAIMAVFQEELAGVRAALEILTAFEAFLKTLPANVRTHVKLGVFPGPCYAVTANDALDFFGQTVNIAARLQGEAGPGELVLMAELGDHAIAEGVLPKELIHERFEAHLKGTSGPSSMVRIAVLHRDP